MTTTPSARPPWVWVAAHGGELVRGDQIISVSCDVGQVTVAVAAPFGNGSVQPMTYCAASGLSPQDAQTATVDLLTLVGEHQARGHAGVVSFRDGEFVFSEWDLT